MKKYQSIFKKSQKFLKESSTMPFDDYIKREFSDRTDEPMLAQTLIDWIEQETGKIPQCLFKETKYYNTYIFNISDLGVNLGEKSLSAFLKSNGYVDIYTPDKLSVGTLNGCFNVSFYKY